MSKTIQDGHVINDKNIRAFLEEGCYFEGKLQFSGVVRLDGHYKGEIETQDTLILGETAVFQGKIKVGALILGGSVEGEIVASERVELLASSKIIGSIVTPRFISFEGCLVEATVSTKKRF